MKLFVNGKELKHYPISQNEYGFSHKNSRYSSGVMQRPLDFGGMKAGDVITSDVAVRIISSSPGASGYTVFQGPDDKQWMCVHVWKFASGVVPAGQQICQIAPTSHNGGYAVHLHVSARQNYQEFFVRSLIFQETPVDTKYYDAIKIDRQDVYKACNGDRGCMDGWFESDGAKEIVRGLDSQDRTDVFLAYIDIPKLKDWYANWGYKEKPWTIVPRADCVKEITVLKSKHAEEMKDINKELVLLREKLATESARYSKLNELHQMLKQQLAKAEALAEVHTKKLIEQLETCNRNAKEAKDICNEVVETAKKQRRVTILRDMTFRDTLLLAIEKLFNKKE